MWIKVKRGTVVVLHIFLDRDWNKIIQIALSSSPLSTCLIAPSLPPFLKAIVTMGLYIMFAPLNMSRTSALFWLVLVKNRVFCYDCESALSIVVQKLELLGSVHFSPELYPQLELIWNRLVFLHSKKDHAKVFKGWTAIIIAYFFSKSPRRLKQKIL